MSWQLMGRYIVTDPEICHGKPTFHGTRIMVSQVLEQVASVTAWESIIAEWRDSISKEAIAEAVRLASQSLADLRPALVPDGQLQMIGNERLGTRISTC